MEDVPVERDGAGKSGRNMRRLMALCTALMLAAPTLADDTTHEQVETEQRKINDGWTVVVYHMRKTGTFSHCGIATTYTPSDATARHLLRAKQMHMFITLNYQTELSFTLMADGWNITTGAPYRIDFNFDGDKEGRWIMGKGRSEIVIAASFPYDQKWLQKFMSKVTLDLRVNSVNIGRFNLKGSSAAIRELFDCFNHHSNNATTSDTFNGVKGLPKSTF